MAAGQQYTADRARAPLRRLIYEVAAEEPVPDGDRLLAELHAARCLADELRGEMEGMIAAARHRDPPTSWQRIGRALRGADRRDRPRPFSRPTRSMADYMTAGRELLGRRRHLTGR